MKIGENFEVDPKKWSEANAIHLWRYYCARGFIEEDDSVIDLGCGHGYGTDLLSRSLASMVVGYDHDKRVLDMKARKLYVNSLDVDFITLNIEKENFADCDYMVCIEVIEHMNDPKALAQKMKESARRIIFVSTPIVPMTGENKHHENQFTVEEVHKLFRDDEWEIMKWANLGGEDGLFVFYRKSWLNSQS